MGITYSEVEKKKSGEVSRNALTNTVHESRRLKYKERIFD